MDGDDILKINETLRESCYTKAFHEKFHGLFRQMRLAGRKGEEELLARQRVMILENLLKLYDFSHGGQKQIPDSRKTTTDFNTTKDDWF